MQAYFFSYSAHHPKGSGVSVCVRACYASVGACTPVSCMCEARVVQGLEFNRPQQSNLNPQFNGNSKWGNCESNNQTASLEMNSRVRESESQGANPQRARVRKMDSITKFSAMIWSTASPRKSVKLW
eukprot:32085-Chlamydomonas_euryale.AAC.3